MTHTSGKVEAVKPSQSFLMKEKGKLTISKELCAQVNKLHSLGAGREWSGVLVYRVVSGDIDDIENFKAVAEGVFPMNYGTSGYTEYEPDEAVLDIYEHYPKADLEKNTKPWKLGQIHSHHSMGTFFSGTDTDELKENAGKYTYYLSLIVNHECKYSAKVAFIAKREEKREETISYKVRNKDKRHHETKTENTSVLVTFDLDISFDNEEWFDNKVIEINKTKTYHNSYGSDNHRYMGAPSYNRPTTTPINEKEAAEKKSLATKVRENLHHLLAIVGKPFAKDAKDTIYYLLRHLNENLPTEAMRNTHISTVMGNLDTWIMETFKAEFYAGDAFLEDKVINQIASSLNVYEKENPVARELVKELKAYYETLYKDEAKAAEKLESRNDKSAEIEQELYYNGYESD